MDIDYNASDSRYKDFRLSRLILHGRSADDSRYSVELDISQSFLFHVSRENDVACLIDFRSKTPNCDVKLYHHNSIDGLATAAEFMTTIWPGDHVFFSGYPANLHDKLDQRPILRAGIIASDPKYNYSSSGKYQGERVAYEAMSTQGSSGSPVYAPARGVGGVHQYERRDIIVGINAGHLVDESKTHSGLSYFIKSTVIREILSAAGVAGA